MQDSRQKMVFVSAPQLEAKVVALTRDYEQLKLARENNWIGVSALEDTLHRELERKDAKIGVVLKKFEIRMVSINAYIVDIRLIDTHIEELITELMLFGKVLPLEDQSGDIKIQSCKEHEEHIYNLMLVDLKERELKLEGRAMKARRRYEMIKMRNTVITSSSTQSRFGYLSFFGQSELNDHDNVQQSDLQDQKVKDPIVRKQGRKLAYRGFEYWRDKIQELTTLIENLKQEQTYVLNDQMNERNECLDALGSILDDKLALDFLKSVKEMKSKRIDTLTLELTHLRKAEKYSSNEGNQWSKPDDKYKQYARYQAENNQKNFNDYAEYESRRKFEDARRQNAWMSRIILNDSVKSERVEILPLRPVLGLLDAFQSKPVEDPRPVNQLELLTRLSVIKFE